MWFSWLFRKKKDPVARAAEIKLKFEAKRSAPPSLFTAGQEQLMKELGLAPGSDSQAREKRIKRKSDPVRLAADEAERLKRIHSTRHDRK
jgi:hypothetical protein